MGSLLWRILYAWLVVKTGSIRAYQFLGTQGAFYALRCFITDLRSCNILLRLDNTTAISYINRFGSVMFPHLTALAKEIWNWCEHHNLFIFALYIASVDNSVANFESRAVSVDTEWSLSQTTFLKLSSVFGPFDINLSASIINTKCPSYVSWFPNPGSIAVDGFTFSWANLKFYAFPPFILLPRVFRKILDDRGEGVVVVPWWPSQSWFPLFCHLVGEPLIFPPDFNLLSSPLRRCHPAWKTLSLTTAKLYGKRSHIAEYLSEP